MRISTETIYQYIYTDKRHGGELHRHLRCQKSRRKRYGSGHERRGMLKNRISIEARPPVVAERSRMGDWEGDTIIGKHHKGGLVTLAERKSRYTLAGHIRSKHAKGVRAAITRLLKPHKDKCHTLTLDNGKEFAEHETIAAVLEMDVFFANPYCSWERELNENHNGLLRQYFPKDMTLTDITDAQVQQAVERLNHRPRKVLGYRTPYEVFFGMEIRYTHKILAVALRT